ncbi:hypothetical protein ACET3Z_021311 [Daucus carota]
MTLGKYSIVNPNDNQPIPDYKKSLPGYHLNMGGAITLQTMWSLDSSVSGSGIGLLTFLLSNISLLLQTVYFEWKSGTAAKD